MDSNLLVSLGQFSRPLFPFLNLDDDCFDFDESSDTFRDLLHELSHQRVLPLIDSSTLEQLNRLSTFHSSSNFEIIGEQEENLCPFPINEMKNEIFRSPIENEQSRSKQKVESIAPVCQQCERLLDQYRQQFHTTSPRMTKRAAQSICYDQYDRVNEEANHYEMNEDSWRWRKSETASQRRRRKYLRAKARETAQQREIRLAKARNYRRKACLAKKKAMQNCQTQSELMPNNANDRAI